jgi:capsular polysaccharide transport system permease protein
MPRSQSIDRSHAPFRRGFKVQFRVIQSLIVRDMMMRYGRNNIGFLWVVLEPMILTMGVMTLWVVAKAPIEHGVQVVALVLTGYMPLTLWRHTSNNGVGLIRNSISALYHRNLTLLDVIAARMVTEFIGTSIAFLIVYFCLLTMGFVDAIHDPGLLILGWVILGALGGGFALLVAALTEYYESAERFVQPFQYLLIPLSGTFFMVDWLPTKAQQYILYNPLVHCYELFRAGFWGPSVTTHYDISYPAIWVIGLVAIGLRMLDAAREQMHGG